MPDPDRFRTIFRQKGWPTDIEILKDIQTGVQYLVLKNGNQVAGITPLLDSDGKVVVTPVR